MGRCSSALDLSVFGRNEIVQYWRGCGHSPPSATALNTFCLEVNDMLGSKCASAVRQPSVPPDLSFGLLLIPISNPFSCISWGHSAAHSLSSFSYSILKANQDGSWGVFIHPEQRHPSFHNPFVHFVDTGGSPHLCLHP